MESVTTDNKQAVLEQMALVLISSLQENISDEIENRLARSEERYYQKRKKEIELDGLKGDMDHKKALQYNDPKKLNYLSKLAKISSRMRKDRAKLDRYESGTKRYDHETKDKYKNENPFLPLLLSSKLKKEKPGKKPKIGFKK